MAIMPVAGAVMVSLGTYFGGLEHCEAIELDSGDDQLGLIAEAFYEAERLDAYGVGSGRE